MVSCTHCELAIVALTMGEGGCILTSRDFTARDKSQVAQGEAECYICHKTHQELYTFIQRKW